MAKFAAIFLIAAFMGSSAFAQNDENVARPKVYQELVDCRQINDTAQRLACFDGASAKMEQAAAARDIVILDRAEVRKTKRSLFGFFLPRLPFFDDDEKDEFTRIESTFASVAPIGFGKYQFDIPDGGTWQTLEPTRSVLREGRELTIKRGAVGGFLMQVGNGGYIPVKRIN